ncbi:MAG: hypothetical protein LUH51_07330 [Firmicutes bacterium]|nr:hypothetical protein [Bacillota bacterium]
MNRYQQMERTFTVILLAEVVFFILYLILAGFGIIWAKVIVALICFAASGYSLWSLYASKEILKQRSLWLTCGFGGLALCTLVSLIVNFPRP